MPSDVRRVRYTFPKLGKKRYGILMHSLESAMKYGCSDRAQFKFHCIQFYEKHGWQVFHDAFPQVSRASLFRWRKRYLDSGKKLNSLVPTSTRPKQTRQMQVPAKVLGFLKEIRKKHPHLSKYKLKPFLDEFCDHEDLPYYSVSWIGKVLDRYQLYFSSRQRVRKRRRRARSGYMIKQTPKPKNLTLGYLQVDGITVHWSGKKLLFLTAIELKTRAAWAKLVPNLSSYHARNFLEEVISSVDYPMHTIHTDNGSEFHALFDQAVQQLELLHLWSPPRTPKIHAHIERFNGTIQREFIDYYVDTFLEDKHLFTKRLSQWLHWYNRKRPHHALNLMTPHQYLVQLQKRKETKSLICP